MMIAMTTHFERFMEKATPRATRLVKLMMTSNVNCQHPCPSKVVIAISATNMAG